MRSNALLVDVGIAIAAVIIILAITPGLAVAGAIAIVVLTACAVSFRRESRRQRRDRDARRGAARPPRGTDRRATRRSNRA